MHPNIKFPPRRQSHSCAGRTGNGGDYFVELVLCLNLGALIGALAFGAGRFGGAW